MSAYLIGRLVPVLLLLFATGAAYAEEGKYTLPRLVGLALENNRLLGSQAARVEEHRRGAAQARAWPGASLDFLAGRKSAAGASGGSYELSLAQPLPLTGKLGLRGRLLDLEADSWSVRRSASEVFVTLDVIRLAYEYSSNRRKAAFVEARQKRFDLIREYLSGRPFATPQGKADSRIVQNRLKLLVADAIQSQAGYKASFEKLKVYIPLAPSDTPDIEVPWLSGAKALEEKEWLAKALGNNPDLRIQRLVVEGAEVERGLAQKDGWPDPAVVASHERAKTVETEKTTSLGLSLALPSWNRNRSGVKSAEQRALAEKGLLGFEERKLKAEFPRALVEYEASRQTAAKYPQSALAELEQQLKEAEEGFRKGQLDLLTFLELDATSAEAYGRVLDAQADLAARLAEIFTLTQERDAVSLLGTF